MKKIRVLLTDDHPVVRVGLRALLNGEPDMEVVGEASNGAQAVTLCAELQPDVAVMDISMPEMDGLEATRRIKAKGGHPQVLILTVHAHERYLFPVLRAGAAGYVLKSTVDTELVEAIRTVAQGGAFLYPAAMRLVLEDYMARLRDGAGADDYEKLSDREREVLKLIALGFTASETAEKLVLGTKSVETYRARIMQKLNLDSRAALVQYALSHGLLSDEPGAEEA
ncbi:MAG: response regulator transcription factor [Chloroflexi bacterium]|nr:response regulator transcription factor [Chloroflexota bacterium]